MQENKEIIYGDYFVEPRYRPANDSTEQKLSDKMNDVGLKPKGKTTTKKYINCFSDVCMANQNSKSGNFCWKMDSAFYAGHHYGYDIAKRVQNSLVKNDVIRITQKGRKGICQIYKFTNPEFTQGLEFDYNKDSRPVVVRERKDVKYYQSARKPKELPRKKFLPKIEELEQEVNLINRYLVDHPLIHPDGGRWDSCKRIFNNASLKQGGRLIGGWQNLPKEERLGCTIDGQEVCEVDIKACYPFLAANYKTNSYDLEEDPYSIIPFVRGDTKYRDLAKGLVSAILSKKGDVSRFPKGKKRNIWGKVISIREKFNIPKDHGVDYYTKQIFQTYPFLREMSGMGLYLMNIESNIIIKTMTDLIDREAATPTFPVHDCLICKVSDKDKVLDTLQSSIIDICGKPASIEIYMKK